MLPQPQEPHPTLGLSEDRHYRAEVVQGATEEPQVPTSTVL